MRTPFHSCAAPLAHPPPLHTRGGTLSFVAGSFLHPRFGAPTLVSQPFRFPTAPPGLRATPLAHPPPCTYVGAHRHPFTPPLWCTHHSVCVWLPCLGCAPPHSHALCARPPCPPAPPACAQREKASGQGGVRKLGGWPWGSLGRGD